MLSSPPFKRPHTLTRRSPLHLHSSPNYVQPILAMVESAAAPAAKPAGTAPPPAAGGNSPPVARRVAGFFHIVSDSLLLVTGVVLLALGAWVYINDKSSNKMGSIPALPHGGSRLADVIAWGAVAIMGAGGVLIVISLLALVGVSLKCAGGVFRSMHVLLGVVAVGALLVVMTVSFLTYRRERTLQKSWARVVKKMPKRICDYERKEKCRGFLDETCNKEKCANCGNGTGAVKISGKGNNGTKVNGKESSEILGHCFLGYTHKRGYLVTGILSSVVCAFMILDLAVICAL